MALKLGKTVSEIKQMSAIEFTRWRLYFPMIQDMQNESRNEAEIERAIARKNGDYDR